jgi:hypothetical protein
VDAKLIYTWTLTWAEVDPARHGFDAAKAEEVVLSLLPPVQADWTSRPTAVWKNLADVSLGCFQTRICQRQNYSWLGKWRSPL